VTAPVRRHEEQDLALDLNAAQDDEAVGGASRVDLVLDDLAGILGDDQVSPT